MADAAGYYRAIQYPDGNLQQSRVCIRSQAPAMGGGGEYGGWLCLWWTAATQ
jgi:hypothetical protein